MKFKPAKIALTIHRIKSGKEALIREARVSDSENLIDGVKSNLKCQYT